MPIEVPFTIVIDGREKAPYTFQGLHADADKHGRPLAVRWQWGFLKSGDYSILGHEDEVCVERKSLEDLYSTLGQHRERFEAEHQRMAKMSFAAVVIEANWQTILNDPPKRSRLNPKTVFRTAVSWAMKYRIAWWTAEDRRMGEVTVFRLLDRWMRLQWEK